MHFTTSPFYEWLDHQRIRQLVHETNALRPGERLVLLKGLVPGLVGSIGLAETEAFLQELAVKARRFDEAQQHPGEGRQQRQTPGEPIGGPTPDGHRHVEAARDPGRPGHRSAERGLEAALWLREVDPELADRYREEAGRIAQTFVAAGMPSEYAEIAAWEAIARIHGVTAPPPSPE